VVSDAQLGDEGFDAGFALGWVPLAMARAR